MYGRLKKHHRITFIMVLILIFLTSGSIWQHNMNRYEKDEYVPPGKLISVNNHKMHILADGEGSPTVILTTGSGTPCAYTDYYYIQKEISKNVRTISYDRPGYGWSEPTSMASTINEQVMELRELLFKAGEKPPYILVGHSLSSLEVVHYAQLFPEEIVGIVLIDGGNPTYYAAYNEFTSLAINHSFEAMRITGIVRALGNIGIFPAFLGEDQRRKLLPDNLQQVDKIMFYNKLGLDVNRIKLTNINEDAREVIISGHLGDIPLIILTASESTKEWKESQVQLKSWSKNSKQEEIVGSSHYIHWSFPYVIIEKIEEVVKSSMTSLPRSVLEGKLEGE